MSDHKLDFLVIRHEFAYALAGILRTHVEATENSKFWIRRHIGRVLARQCATELHSVPEYPLNGGQRRFYFHRPSRVARACPAIARKHSMWRAAAVAQRVRTHPCLLSALFRERDLVVRLHCDSDSSQPPRCTPATAVAA